MTQEVRGKQCLILFKLDEIPEVLLAQQKLIEKGWTVLNSRSKKPNKDGMYIAWLSKR